MSTESELCSTALSSIEAEDDRVLPDDSVCEDMERADAEADGLCGVVLASLGQIPSMRKS